MAKSSITKMYEGWATFISHFQSLVLLCMRLYWGWQFHITGMGKLKNLNRTSEYFASLHIPAPHLNAVIAGTTECVGGLLLLAGLASRLITLPLIFVLCIAYATAERDSLKVIFSDSDKFVSAAPFLFLVCCVIVLVFGPGWFSIDGVIAYMRRGKKHVDQNLTP